MQLEDIQKLLDFAGKEFGDEKAPQVLVFAAASQTMHLSPEEAAKTFEAARRSIGNSGAADHIQR